MYNATRPFAITAGILTLPRIKRILHSRGFFDDVKPYNFVTISTPHVGLPRYPGLLSACFNTFGPRLLSRSGKQLSLLDQWSQSQRPILEVMADNGILVTPCLSCLTLYLQRVYFSNRLLFFYVSIYTPMRKARSSFVPVVNLFFSRVNDLAVPYVTGAIEVEDPFIAQKGLKMYYHMSTTLALTYHAQP